MEAPVIAAILGVLGALVSGAIATWAAFRVKRLDHLIERDKLWVTAYEKTLFEHRLSDYRVLWALTEQTSRRHVQNLTTVSAKELTEELTRWYYRKGGILLTSASRNAYFRARESLEGFGPEQIKQVVHAFSALRTALCEDLNSRNGPALKRPDASGGDGDGDGEDYPETLFSQG